MNLPGKRLLLGAAVAVAALGVGGIAYAASDDPAPEQGYVTIEDGATTPSPGTGSENGPQGNGTEGQAPAAAAPGATAPTARRRTVRVRARRSRRSPKPSRRSPSRPSRTRPRTHDNPRPIRPGPGSRKAPGAAQPPAQRGAGGGERGEALRPRCARVAGVWFEQSRGGRCGEAIGGAAGAGGFVGSAGACAVRGEAGRRRPGPTGGADARRAAGPRALPAGRCAGRRQDAGRPDAGRGDRRPVRPAAVHPGPGAGRHRRDPDLAAVGRGLRHRARPDLRQPRAGRRDQPRPGQGAVGVARGNGRAPGQHRRRQLPAARAVPGARDPEPDRVRGCLRVARGAAGPVPAEDHGRLPDPAGGAHHPAADELAPAARERRTHSGAWSAQLQEATEDVFVHNAVAEYVVRLVHATRVPQQYGINDLRRRTGVRRRARGPRWAWSPPAGRSRCCAAGTTCCRPTCTTWRTT